MIKITQNENEIVLREIPIFFWVIGAFGVFLFGGGLILLLLYAISDPRDAFSSHDGSRAGSVMAVIIYGVFVLVLAALIALFAGFALSSVITTRVDRLLQFVEISRRNLLRKQRKRYQFSQIKGFATESRRVRNGHVYYVCLVLKNRRKIDIERQGSEADGAQDTAARLNGFLGSPSGEKAKSD